MTRDYKTLRALRNNGTLSEISLEEAKILMDNENGCLDLGSASIEELPTSLVVSKDLWLGKPIQELPHDLVVGGNLYIAGTDIKHIPATIKVGGGIYAYGSSLEALPDNFLVVGDLDIRDTLVLKLPKQLAVGGELVLDSDIQNIPAGLKVGWRIQGSPAIQEYGEKNKETVFFHSGEVYVHHLNGIWVYEDHFLHRVDEYLKRHPKFFECETCDCVYNNAGICRYAGVFGTQPIITEDDGCVSSVIPFFPYQ